MSGSRTSIIVDVTNPDDCACCNLASAATIIAGIDYLAKYSHKSNITIITTDRITESSSCDVIK